MSGSFLTRLSQEINNHTTFIWKLWLTVLVMFRIVLTAVGGDSIHNNEQRHFVCLTEQRGCENVCYNALAPLSQARFWLFQIILVSTPAIMYLGFSTHKMIYHPEDPIVCNVLESERDGDRYKHGRQRIKQDGLMKAYVVQLLACSALEVGGLLGQYALYGFKVLPLHPCSLRPCPFSVDCFVSSSTEKTIFLLIAYAGSGLCLLLNTCDLLYLGVSGIQDFLRQRSEEAKEEESPKCAPSAPANRLSSRRLCAKNAGAGVHEPPTTYPRKLDL